MNPSTPTAGPHFDVALRSGWREYALVVGIIVAVTWVGLLAPESYYLSVGLIYLLAVIVLSLRVGRGPILAAGILSAITWEYVFMPPRFQFAINSLQDLLLFITYFVVAIIAGELTSRIREQANTEQVREKRATALFHFTRALAEAKTLSEAVFAAVQQTDSLFGGQSALAMIETAGADFSPNFIGTFSPDISEHIAAMWAFAHREPAVGRFSGGVPPAEGAYFPLIRGETAIGVLAVKLPAARIPTPGQRDLLEAFARQLALMVEREHLRVVGEHEKLLAESEKLHRVLLESVSHELRTPLAVIAASSEDLLEADPGDQAALAVEIRFAALRLNRLVGNLLDQTRLESGALKPRVDLCDVCDLVNAAIEATAEALVGHPTQVILPEENIFVRADFALTEQALVNLLVNAALHTEAGTLISLSTGIDPSSQRVYFTVADRGPGFPSALRERLFKKFARGDAASPGGLGLGLSIVHGFIVAQSGEVVVRDQPGGGAAFTIYLPHATLENPPPE